MTIKETPVKNQIQEVKLQNKTLKIDSMILVSNILFCVNVVWIIFFHRMFPARQEFGKKIGKWAYETRKCRECKRMPRKVLSNK